VDLLDVDLSGGAAAALPPPILGAVGGADPWSPPKLPGAMGWNSPNTGMESPHDPWAPNQRQATSGKPPQVYLLLNHFMNPLSFTKFSNLGQAVLRTNFFSWFSSGDPWAHKPMSTPGSGDPWSSNGNGKYGGGGEGELEDEFDVISKRTVSDSSMPFMMSPLTSTLEPAGGGSGGKKKNPLEFLGENSNLVNLDNLLPLTKSASPTFGGPGNQPNPFGGSSLLSAPANNGGNPMNGAGGAQQVVNPFQTVIQKPSINEVTGTFLSSSPSLLTPRWFSEQFLHAMPSFQIREKQLQGMGPPPTNNAFGQPQNNPWSPVKAENPFFNN